MTVPTEFIVLAGLLLLALVLWLLVPSGVFTFTVVMVSAAKHRIATPADLQAAFDLLPP
jgi:hypothetical protein